MKLILNYVSGSLIIKQSSTTVSKKLNKIIEYSNCYGDLSITVDKGEDVELIVKDKVYGNVFINTPDVFFQEIDRKKIGGTFSIISSMEPNFPSQNGNVAHSISRHRGREER